MTHVRLSPKGTEVKCFWGELSASAQDCGTFLSTARGQLLGRDQETERAGNPTRTPR